MSVSLASFELTDRARRIVDWSVFYTGALSLTIAIGGTVLTNLDTGNRNQADAQDAIEAPADPALL